MKINDMAQFQDICRHKLVKWYNKRNGTAISERDTYIVWSCKALQNFKCLASTTVDGDGIYAEYTYNGDKQELYEDVYSKLTNKCYEE